MLAVVVALGWVGCEPPDRRAPAELPPRDFTCAAGVSAPCALTEPALEGQARTVLVPPDGEGRTLTFVLDTLAFSRCDEGAPGFDLDGLDSGDGLADADAPCVERARDHRATYDPLHRGVDNVVCEYIPTFDSLLPAERCPGGVSDGCFDATIAQRIAEGALLWLVALGGVDSLEHDARISFRFYAGRLVGGSPALGPDGRLAAGQTFMSFPIGEPGAGDIFEGRARITTASLPLDFGDALGGLSFQLPLRDVELRFDVREGALLRGVVGGHALVDDLYTPPPHGEDTVRSVVAARADLLPRPDAPDRCDALSAGLLFSATFAEHVPGPPPSDARPGRP